MEKTNKATRRDGVGAVPSNLYGRSKNVILDEAETTVRYEDWLDVKDGRSRLNDLRGLAMDSKRNLFYSSEKHWANGVAGVYQRTYDGKRRYIAEWNEDSMGICS